MASRESVYEQFGRAAHTAQMLKWDLGTALLAIDAIDTKSFLKPDADAYLRLRNAIDRKTLGRSLKQIRKKLKLADDVDLVTRFDAASNTRNRLTHHFFRNHHAAWFDDAGRDAMVADLRNIDADLSQAWGIAQGIASALIDHLREHGGAG